MQIEEVTRKVWKISLVGLVIVFGLQSILEAIKGDWLLAWNDFVFADIALMCWIAESVVDKLKSEIAALRKTC
jgi:hypothetical protein